MLAASLLGLPESLSPLSTLSICTSATFCLSAVCCLLWFWESLFISVAWHSIGYNRFKGLPITLFDASNTLADRHCPSLLLISSCIRPSLQLPLGNSSFMRTTSPTLAVYGDCTLGPFSLVCWRSLRLSKNSWLHIFQKEPKYLSPYFHVANNLSAEEISVL